MDAQASGPCAGLWDGAMNEGDAVLALPKLPATLSDSPLARRGFKEERVAFGERASARPLGPAVADPWSARSERLVTAVLDMIL